MLASSLRRRATSEREKRCTLTSACRQRRCPPGSTWKPNVLSRKYRYDQSGLATMLPPEKRSELFCSKSNTIIVDRCSATAARFCGGGGALTLSHSVQILVAAADSSSVSLIAGIQNWASPAVRPEA